MIPKYKKRSDETTNSHIEELGKNSTPDVLLIGTSMFERFRYAPEAEKGWKQFGLDQQNIFNCGVGGDKICNILYRLLDRNVLDHITHDPRLTIIMCGANDIERTKIDEMIDGTYQIIKHVKNKFPSTKLHILGIYPRKSDKLDESNVYSRMKEYNDKLEKLCLGLNISYDWYGSDIMGSDDMIDTSHLVDNVHFSEVGYSKFAERLAKIILL